MGSAKVPSAVLMVGAVLLILAELAFNLLSFDTFIFFGLPLVAGVVVAIYNAWRDPERTLIDHVTDILRIYFGGHLLWSGLRFWFTDINLTTSMDSGYGVDDVVFGTAVPVPPALWLFGSGLLALAGGAGNRKARS